MLLCAGPVAGSVVSGSALYCSGRSHFRAMPLFIYSPSAAAVPGLEDLVEEDRSASVGPSRLAQVIDKALDPAANKDGHEGRGRGGGHGGGRGGRGGRGHGS